MIIIKYLFCLYGNNIYFSRCLLYYKGKLYLLFPLLHNNHNDKLHKLHKRQQDFLCKTEKMQFPS